MLIPTASLLPTVFETVSEAAQNYPAYWRRWVDSNHRAVSGLPPFQGGPFTAWVHLHIGRGGAIRTLMNGFGDRNPTIG